MYNGAQPSSGRVRLLHHLVKPERRTAAALENNKAWAAFGRLVYWVGAVSRRLEHELPASCRAGNNGDVQSLGDTGDSSAMPDTKASDL